MEEKQGKKISVSSAVLLALAAAFTAAAIMYVLGAVRQRLTAQPKDKLDEIEELIENRFIETDADMELAQDMAAAGMVASLGDQWSYYMPASQVADYQASMNNRYVGIGVTVQKDGDTGILVVAVSAYGTAYPAGIEAGDRIVAVDGTDVRKMTLDEAKALIQGEEGTSVTIGIVKADGTEKEYLLKRAQVQTPPVTSEMIDEIGYIRIEDFCAGCAEYVAQEIETLRGQGAQGLVFDVRFNGGGYLTELTEILDLLLPEGDIFIQENRQGTRSTITSNSACLEIPISVLVNDSTYSAAEYFAEALRDYNWATVVGQQTTGKGYAQNTFYLEDGSAVVLSTSKYYTPGGACLAGVGITPDYEIEISEEEYYAVYSGTLSREEDSQLQRALESVREQIAGK